MPPMGGVTGAMKGTGAGLALNILNYMGMVKRTGKQGNSYIYEVE